MSCILDKVTGFLGGSCMSENLKTWGKCANLFFNLRQLFFAKRKQYRYNFCVLRFWRKVKVMHIALIYDIMSSMNPFHWFIVNKLQNYLFRFKMRQTRLYMKITYIQVVLSLIIKSHIYQSKYHLLFNQYGDEQNKFSSNNVRTI